MKILHVVRSVRGVLVTVVMAAALGSEVQAVTLQGQVTNAVTGVPLQGARITVDAAPADGTPEFEAMSNAFGFYEIRDVPAADQLLRATLGGYDPVERTVTTTGTTMNENFALTPMAVVTPIDIIISVVDATTNYRIPGIPVVLQRYDSATDTTPDAPVTLVTDTEGNAMLYGAIAGHYTFLFNSGAGKRPGWESYPKTGVPTPLTAISSPHQAVLQLKHVPQSIKLRVEGCSPVTEVVEPLENIVVELTGVHPDDHDLEVVPAREMATDAAGEVSFHNLMPVHWRTRIKRIGYDLTDTFLEPDPASDDLPGKQPGEAEVLAAILGTTSVEITLKSIYPTTDYYEGIEVVLEGIANTNAEGISRTLDTDLFPDKRLFVKLLPGRYVVRVNDTFVPDDPETTPAPHFQKEEIIEVLEDEAKEVDIMLDVRPAIVRARLFKADGIAAMDTGGGNDFVLRRPLYVPHEAPEILMGFGGENVTGASDANGDTVFVVYPGLYGFAVPSMTNYVGSHIQVVHDLAADARRQGWPVLSGAAPSPAPQGGEEGDPLVINSDREYRIDLYTHKKGQTFALDLAIAGENPTELIVQGIPTPFTTPQCSLFAELLADPAIFDLTNSATSEIISGTTVRRGDRLVVEFEGVTPGTWTWTATHDHYDIEAIPVLPGSTPETFTVPDLPAYPGADYPVGGPPPLFSIYNPTLPYQLWPNVFPATATYKSTGPITITRKVWDDLADPPEYVDAGTDSDPIFDFIRPDYAGGALFCAAKRPLDSFDFWIRDPLGDWFAARVTGNGSAAFTIFVGGPMHNLTPTPPSMVGTITLKAVSREAPDEEIPGITFTLGGGSTFPAGTVSVPSAYDGPISLTTATDPTGKWLFKSSTVLTSGTFGNEILIVAEMGRALTVSGTVKVNNTALEPIEGAKVRFRDRFGDARFPSEVTDEDGYFILPPTLETPVFFVDVTAPGFKPKRMRFAGADPAIGGTGNSGTLSLDLRLDPLPAPTVAAEIDRFGLFLSGVSFSGDASATTLARAVDELTATWTATATPPAPVTYDELNFDNGDGSPGSSVMRTLTDDVALVAIVDPRLFPEKSSKVSGTGAAGAPEEGEFDFLPDPDPTKVVARRKWWDSITSQTYEDENGDPLPKHFVIYNLAESMTKDPMTGVTTITGKQPLWTLPPGKYAPFIVVETKHGALGMYQITYTGEDEAKILRGLRPPLWLAAVLDVLGFTKKFAGSPQIPLGEQKRALDKFMSGRFKPKRVVSGVISVGDEGDPDAGFLKYEYNGNFLHHERQSAAPDGILGLATDTVGGAMEIGIDYVIDGKESSITLEGRGESTSGAKDTEYFKPSRLTEEEKKNVEHKLVTTGSASVSLTEVLDPDADPLEVIIRSRFFQGLAIETRYNLKPYAKVLPYAGPVLRGLDTISADNLQIDGVARVAAGIDVVATYTSRYPKLVTAGSIIPGSYPHPERGHLLGGREVAQPGASADTLRFTANLCMNTGLGAEIALGELAGGSIFLNLVGNECVIPIAEEDELPAMNVEFNIDGTWPIINKVSGEVNVTVNVFLDLLLTRLEKEWKLIEVPFSHQFGTESIFDLIPMAVTFTSRSLADDPPADYLGTSPQLVQGIISSARHMHRIAAGSTDVMIFPDNDAMTGKMLLRFAARTSETAWAAPVTITEEDGIVASDIARLSTGTLLAVWTSIDEADIGTPYAPSTIRFSTSTDGGTTWTAPATAATLTGVADVLHLETAGTFNALVFMTCDGMPGSALRTMHGMTYSTSTGWSASSVLVTSQEITSMDATGTGASVTVAYTDGADALKVFSWSGGSIGTVTTGSVAVKPGVSVIDTGSGLSMILSLPQTGGILPRIFFSGILLGGTTLYATEQPDGITGTLVGGSPARVLVTWTDGPTGSVRYALLDATTAAAVSAEPLEITRNTVGRYTIAEAVHSPADHATIFTRFHAPGALPELRQFIVSRTTGTAFTDRDGDGLNDIDELRIVDASAEDAFTVIDSVLPGNDFDGDGASDGDELAAGTDPTDPNDRPVPPGITVAATAPEAQEFGLISGQFQITRSDATLPVDVLFSLGGTAINGTDYHPGLASPLHFDAGQMSRTISIIPHADTLPEGAETIVLTLLEDPSYTLGTSTMATVTLADRPSDDWRRVHFPASPETVVFTGDTDNDGLNEIGEFGLVLDPNHPDAGGLPLVGTTADGNYLTLTYTRPLDADVFYTVQVATNLAGWQSGPLHTEEISRVTNAEGTLTITVRSLTPISSVERQQMRLEIVRD